MGGRLETLREEDGRTVLVVDDDRSPLRHGAVVGVRMVGGSAGLGFSPDSLGIVGALARQGAVAIENALTGGSDA